jgi:hypothetical protein
MLEQAVLEQQLIRLVSERVFLELLDVVQTYFWAVLL